jgi:hypothetical protein
MHSCQISVSIFLSIINMSHFPDLSLLQIPLDITV